jgi:hypothetical protein
MLKRIHNLYIFAATLLTGSMFFCNFARILGPEGAELTIRYYEKLPYLVMLIMLLTAGVLAIFSYRNNILQARVCTLTALMLIGFQIWLGVDFLRYHNEMIFSITMMFPVAAAILNLLAARATMIDGLIKR